MIVVMISLILLVFYVFASTLNRMIVFFMSVTDEGHVYISLTVWPVATTKFQEDFVYIDFCFVINQFMLSAQLKFDSKFYFQ